MKDSNLFFIVFLKTRVCFLLILSNICVFGKTPEQLIHSLL